MSHESEVRGQAIVVKYLFDLRVFSWKTGSARYGIGDHASTAQRICMRSELCYFLNEDD